MRRIGGDGMRKGEDWCMRLWFERMRGKRTTMDTKRCGAAEMNQCDTQRSI
jgi:hypothetical protein